MIVVQVRYHHEVDVGVLAQVCSARHPVQHRGTRPKDRVGHHPHALDLYENGGVSEVGQEVLVRHGVTLRPHAMTCSEDGSEADVLEHLGDEGRDRGPLRPVESDMGEEWMALELLNDSDDAVMSSNTQVVALRDIVGKNHT